MKSPFRKIFLFASAGAMLLGIVSGICFSNTNKVYEVSAGDQAPSTTYTVEDPTVYYKNLSTTESGDTFLASLRKLNLSKRKSTVTYSGMGTSTSGMFKYTDYDPKTVQYDSNGQPYGTKILSFYSGKSVTGWNREHVWPNSRGGGNGGGSGSPYVDADIYMPRPTITAENSNRGNSKYVEGKAHSSQGWDPITAFGANNCYDSIRGECARIIFYCMTVNSKLVLDDTETGGKSSVTMGKISDLLKWNIENPVNEREINRNSGGQYLQGNRNAFVDHPEYACRIWANYNTETKRICASQPSYKVLDHLVLVTQPNNKIYTEGDIFNPAGATVEAYYSDDSHEDVTSKVTWSTAKLDAGQTSITGTYKENGIVKYVSVGGLTVNIKIVNVTDVSLNKDAIQIGEGNVAMILATVYPTNATNKNVTYSSSNTGIATVTNDGKVVGVSKGNATITVTTVDQGKTATCSVEVIENDIPVTAVHLDTYEKELDIGEDFKLTETVLPNDASIKEVIWSSSDDNIASVDANGIVTAHSSGIANITVTTSDQGKTATCKVIVGPQKEEEESKLVEICVKKPPYKTTYYQGDDFDFSGLEVEGHYLDGTIKDVTDECTFVTPSLSKLGKAVLKIKHDYVEAISLEFQVISDPVQEIEIIKEPRKLNYFIGDTELLLYGLEVQARCLDDKTFDVTNLVKVTADLTLHGTVPMIIEFEDCTPQIVEIQVSANEPTKKEKAMNYLYAFDDTVYGVDKKDVTINEWEVCEFNFNKLDSEAKNYLKNLTYSDKKVSATDGNEDLESLVKQYDQIILAREELNDFIGRNPQPPKPNLSKILLNAFYIFILPALVITLILVLSITLSKKKKRRAGKR